LLLKLTEARAAKPTVNCSQDIIERLVTDQLVPFEGNDRDM
jgi:hypothetical protein